MKGLKTFFFALIFVIIAFFGLALGAWIGGLPSTGVFTSWELLNSPVKFTQIVDLSSNGVWARTSDNKLYFWSFDGNKWIETTGIPNNTHENDFSPMRKGKDCPENPTYPKKYPGKIVECAVISLPRGSGYFGTYFALLEDGTLWEWEQPAGSDVPLMEICISPSIGLLLGILAGVFFLRTLQKRFDFSLNW